MAERSDHWPAHRVYRLYILVWAAVFLGLVVRFEFGKSEGIENIAVVILWTAHAGLLMFVATIHATFARAQREAVRTLAEIAAITVLAVGAGFGTGCVFRCLGLGHWPPRNGIYADAYREHRATLTTECERLLAEARARDADPAKPDASPSDPYAEWPTLERSAPLEALGVASIRVARDGRSLHLVFWEGTIHVNPRLEKGLLFVDPLAATDRAKWMVEHSTVANLGDGWYVYEE